MATTTPSAALERHQAGSPELRRVSVALFVAGLMTFMSLYTPQSLLPVLATSFHASPVSISLLVSVSTGALALAVVPVSSLSERFGRTRVMRMSAVATAVTGLLVPLSPDFTVLLVMRALEGVALAGIPAVAMAYLAEEVDGGSLGGAMGRYIAGNSAGGLLGRLIPGVAVDFLDWRLAVGIVSVLSLGCAVVFLRLLPDSRFHRPAPIRPGAIVSALRGHLGDPGLRRLYAAAFLLMAGFVTVYNYLGFRLLDAPFDLPRAVVGMLFVMYLAGTVSSAVAGGLADRVGRRPVVLCGIGVLAVGLLLTITDSLVAVAGGLLVFTAGFFAAHTVASAWVGRRAVADRALASGGYVFFYYLGSSVGGTLGGIAFEHAHWAGTAGYVLALAAIAAMLVATIRPLRR